MELSTRSDGQAVSVVSPSERWAGSRRWIALAFIALAQLMIALDATIMNIALPSAQHALGFSDTERQWVITAYTVTFGGLLLLGGRIADHVGRRRAFLIGLVGFALVSAVGAMATNLGVLIAARAAQGGFGALLGPTVLALLAVTFAEPRERAKAFAIFGAIAGGGGALGLVLGGVLTQDLSWRACLYVNVAVAIVAAFGVRYLPGNGGGERRALDVTGAVLATVGVATVVYACAQADAYGWGSAVVVGLLIAGGVLLGAFTWWESRVVDPLLPLRILRDRNRMGAYVSVAFAVAGMLGLFLFLTYYLQVVLGFRPITAGLAFLPLSGAVLASSQAITRLLPRVPPRVLIAPGLLLAAVAMLLLTRLTPDGTYASGVLPAEILLGLGIGCVFVPAISTATGRIEPRDAGVAAAVVNAAQQIGGSVGVAVLNTVAASATFGYLASHPPVSPIHTAALVHGYTTAAAWAAGILAVAAAIAAVLIDAAAPQQRTSEGTAR